MNLLLIGLLSICLTAEPASANSTRPAALPLQACVPSDAMGAYFAHPSAETEAAGTNTAQMLTTWIITLKAMGLIPQQGRVLADVIGSFPLLTRCPHAVVLLDVSAQQPARGIYKLNTLQAVLLLDNRGHEAEVDRRLRDLLATYTDASQGRIETIGAEKGTVPISPGSQSSEGSQRNESMPSAGRNGDSPQARNGDSPRGRDGDSPLGVHYRLTDQRLPEWAVVEWGQVGDFLLVGFGQGAFEKVAATVRAPGGNGTLAADPWFRRAHVRCHGPDSGLEVYGDLARLRRRLGEVVPDRTPRVFAALQISTAERLLWTVGFDDRALRSEVMVRSSEQPEQYAMLTGREVTDAAVTAAIPAEARRYAAFHFPLAAAVRQIRDAYLKARSPRKRERFQQAWAQLETRFGFRTEPDVLEKLGEYVVLTNWPTHPLRIPLLGTIWVQYRGDRAEMSRAVDRLMQACQEALNPTPASQPAGTTRSWMDALKPQLSRDETGLWYLKLGVAGPALGVADGWIVISHSRQAVQANLAHLRTVIPPASQSD